MSSIRLLLSFLLITVLGFSCKFEDPIKNKVFFEPVKGIGFTEVRRSFETGLIFNKDGYQLEPIWQVKFLSDTVAKVLNPDKNIFLDFPVTLDHDSIFNISGTWLKATHVSKDSLIFQVLKVENKTVYYVKSNVFMTLYANDYIKKALHKTVEEARRPQKKDTAYILNRMSKIEAKPDSFFAARKPVQFISKNKQATIDKKEIEADIMNKWDKSEEYMFPEYNIRIKKAYDDFSYSFWATVDQNGKIYYQKSLIYVFPEFEQSTNKTIRGIVDGYLSTYFDVIPGSTLGMPHTSAIVINVKGTKK
ncbi:hypothetical protein [Mucilaginibacter antarcticus]|uniref:Uncharacterized protein n=1 Tax=Mucilaginibacter antarcticus TaxID=1855725 RepID=A0ABW5XSM0_9SPHI